MQGLSSNAEKVFQAIREFDLLKEYVLIGGTALSLQIDHRLSEDLDFCKWQDNPRISNKEIQWPEIEKFLQTKGSVKTEIIDLYQVHFYLNEVKISFYSNSISDSREVETSINYDNISLATIPSLGTMKLEVMLRRNKFRDYYDIYSILQEGISLKEIVIPGGRYSRHRLKTKTILSILSNGSLFKKEENFTLLNPKYNVSSADIQEFMHREIRKEFKP